MGLHIISAQALLRCLDGGLSPQQAVVIEALTEGRPLSWADLIARLYGDDPEGGPLYAKSRLRVCVFYLRKKGFAIRSLYGYGYTLGVH